MTKTLRLMGCLALLGLLQACTHANGSGHTALTEQPRTTEELRAELLAQEQRAPALYLNATGTYRRSLPDQLVLEGDIVNTATLANFKDPMLAVTWYSKTGAELGTKQYPVYELVRAQRTTHFRLQTIAPGYVATVNMGVSDAIPIE
ncbi:MAG: hypothetical protein EOO56_02785 [Hymenobacter sp.]|nr:MAG: hypothetical protein EOO56_02785 [Hymenobacter sp.]